MQIRPSAPSDREALLDVCVRTADAGVDARGALSDDDVWGLIYAVPYAERHPDLSWVVEDPSGRVVGYIVATDDTNSFEEWFRRVWWPGFQTRFPAPTDARTREEGLLAYAYGRGAHSEPLAQDYPAHLHIDLLPEAQGSGLGRRLMETLLGELTRRRVAGAHLGIDPRNTSAAAFYERLGFTRVPALPGAVAYGIRLTS